MALLFFLVIFVATAAHLAQLGLQLVIEQTAAQDQRQQDQPYHPHAEKLLQHLRKYIVCDYSRIIFI